MAIIKALLIIIGGVMLAILLTSGPNKSQSSTIKQEGYFKSSAKDRIMSFSYTAQATEQEIKQKGLKQMRTDRMMTASYFYPDNKMIPRDGLTNAKSVAAANNILNLKGLSAWRYIVMQYRNGSSEFVNCQKTPKNTLCRQ